MKSRYIEAQVDTAPGKVRHAGRRCRVAWLRLERGGVRTVLVVSKMSPRPGTILAHSRGLERMQWRPLSD